MNLDLKRRLTVAVWGIPLVLACSYFGGWLFTLLVALVAGFAGYEFLRMARKIPLPGFTWLAVVAIGSIPVITHLFGPEAIYLFLLIALLVVGVASLKFNAEGGFSHFVSTTFAIVLFGLSFSTLILIRDDAVWPSNLIGGLVIVYIWAGVWMADTFAYVFGRWLGRHPLSALSPKKTVEGTLGGIFVALVWGLLAALTINGYLTWYDRIVIGLLIGIMSVIGDLVESMVKRSVGVKDSGDFFPGHGGMFDRFDSLMFVVPSVYLYMLATGILHF